MMTRIGLYPGTFDPVTLGHMDIIRRGAKLVDKLVIGVTTNPSKSPLFTLDQRLDMVRRECADMPARDRGSSPSTCCSSTSPARSARVSSCAACAPVADFEYEYQMAGMTSISTTASRPFS